MNLTSSVRQVETSIKAVGKDLEKMYGEMRQMAKHHLAAITRADGLALQMQMSEKKASFKDDSSSSSGADATSREPKEDAKKTVLSQDSTLKPQKSSSKKSRRPN